VGACSAPTFYPLSLGFASLKFSSSRADNTSMAGRASTFQNNHLTGNSLIYTSTYLEEAPGPFLFQRGKPSPLGQVADFASLLRRSGNGYEGREVAFSAVVAKATMAKSAATSSPPIRPSQPLWRSWQATARRRTAERDKWLGLRDLRLGVFEGTAPSCQQVIPRTWRFVYQGEILQCPT